MKNVQNWYEIFLESFSSLWEQTITFLPKILGALFIFFIGYLLARLLSYIVARLLKYAKFDELADKVNTTSYLEKANIKLTPSKLIAKFVYYIILLLLFTSGAEALGWHSVTNEISKILAYLPKLFIAIIIFIVGTYLATLVRDIISGTTNSLGISTGRIISSFVFYLIMIMVTLTALRQGGIDTSIITSNMFLILGAILAAASISYGFASRDVLSNILAGYVGKNTYQKGMKIEVDNTLGIIVDISNIGLTLKDDAGDLVIIPSSALLRNKVKIIKPS